MLERILVGVDGSEGSAVALRWAIDLAKALDAEIVAVHAFDVPTPVIAPETGVPVGLGVEEVEVERTLRETAEDAFVTDWSAPLEDSGVRYRRLLEEGSAGQVLLEVADRERPGLLVTGRRGRSALTALLAGSVSEHLVHHSRLPVTVVPAAGDRHDPSTR